LPQHTTNSSTENMPWQVIEEQTVRDAAVPVIKAAIFAA
jgi:hypothetical protein